MRNFNWESVNRGTQVPHLSIGEFYRQEIDSAVVFIYKGVSGISVFIFSYNTYGGDKCGFDALAGGFIVMLEIDEQINVRHIFWGIQFIFVTGVEW